MYTMHFGALSELILPSCWSTTSEREPKLTRSGMSTQTSQNFLETTYVRLSRRSVARANPVISSMVVGC